MKISKNQSVFEEWDNNRTWNYKLTHLQPYQSVIYAEIRGDHSEVVTTNLERIYYIIEGRGEFVIGDQIIQVSSGDVLTVPPQTVYNYHSLSDNILKVLVLMELYQN